VTLEDPPMTQAEAQALLEYELRHTYLPGALRHCPGLITDTKRLNAIVDFCYNLGVGKLQTSTLKKKINIPNSIGYRIDIGCRLEKQLPILKKMGYTNKKYC